jgi:hypothetical protein
MANSSRRPVFNFHLGNPGSPVTILSLNVHHFDHRLDAFEAITVPLYFQCKLPLQVDATFPQMEEMSLELRLNLAAFYL